MSDISNVPSLKSLVNAGTSHTSQTTPTDKSPNFKSIIQRNHSAKSLASSIGYTSNYEKSDKLDPDFLDCVETDRMIASPIRKCETVIALSGMGPRGASGSSCATSACPSRAPTPSTVAAASSHLHHSSSASCSGSRKNSSFNLFTRLSMENRHDAQ